MDGKVYDVAIVGCGPAGMFCAIELLKHCPETSIIMFDKGTLRTRDRKSENASCGWGGAGAFSDGKLTLSCKVGGYLIDFLEKEEFDELMHYVESQYVAFGGKQEIEEPNEKAVRRINKLALEAGLTLIPYRVHHFGSDYAWDIVMNIHKSLTDHGVEAMLSTTVDEVIPPSEKNGLWTVKIAGGAEYKARNVLVSPGREGEEWWIAQAEKLKLRLKNNGVDIGVRVEVRNEVMEELTHHLHDLKLIFKTSSDDKVRTFCVCPSGWVTDKERYHGGLITVNGHSYKAEERASPNTNFAILVTMFFTEPFKDPVAYGKYVVGLANLLTGGRVLVQRLADLRLKRRSTMARIKESNVTPTLKIPQEAVPGDLRLAIPSRQMEAILEMIDAMSKIAPGLGMGDTLLYGTEVKFYSKQVELKDGFETKRPGLYVAGDGSGYTRGLLQSSMMGILVARHIAKKFAAKTSAPTNSKSD